MAPNEQHGKSQGQEAACQVSCSLEDPPKYGGCVWWEGAVWLLGTTSSTPLHPLSAVSCPRCLSPALSPCVAVRSPHKMLGMAERAFCSLLRSGPGTEYLLNEQLTKQETCVLP